MPRLDLELADETLRAAAAKLRRKLPATYPDDPATSYRAHRNRATGRSWGTVVLVADAAEELLADARRRELEAVEAQELAIRALRNLGGASPSWARVGELVGLTMQGAHKRYAKAAGERRAQLTLEDREAEAEQRAAALRA